jgi:hypothetical protein
MRALTLLFFAAATFLLGSTAVDAELARTGTFQAFLALVWIVTVIPSVIFLVAALVFARRDSST